MATGDKLPAGCFPKSTKCLVLQDGTSLDYAIKELQEALLCETDSKTSCEAESASTESSDSSIGNITTTGSRSTSTVSTPISINVKPGATSTLVSYDFSEAVSSCGCGNTSPEITFTDKNGARICRNTNLVGSENLRPDQVPATVTAEIICNKASGQEVLTYSTKLTNTSKQGYLQSTKLSPSGTLEVQSEVNEHFDSCISDLKSKVDSISNVSHNGITGIENIVCDLEEKINSFSNNETEDKDFVCNGKTISLLETVCSLVTDIAALKEQNELLASELQRLSTQYNTLYTIETNK